MSKTTEIAKSKSAAPKTRARAEVGPAMLGRDIFVQALEREGVDVIFAYPGGAKHGNPPVTHHFQNPHHPPAP